MAVWVKVTGIVYLVICWLVKMMFNSHSAPKKSARQAFRPLFIIFAAPKVARFLKVKNCFQNLRHGNLF